MSACAVATVASLAVAPSVYADVPAPIADAGAYTCIASSASAVAAPPAAVAAAAGSETTDAALTRYLVANKPCSDGQVPQPDGSVGPPPMLQPFAGGNWFAYAEKYQAVSDGVGAYAAYSLQDPSVTNGANHSLAEVSVAQGSGASLDTMETGWTVSPAQYPAAPKMSHFWIYKGVHNYQGAAGYPSCYDGCAGSGYHQVSTYAFPGAAIPGDGTVVPIEIYHTESLGRWDYFFNGVDIGYYLDTSWPEYFHRTTQSAWYGEVSSTTSTPCSDMGTGAMPTSSTGAQINSPTSFVGPSGAQSSYLNYVSDPGWYGMVTTSGATHAFRYGGGGAC